MKEALLFVAVIFLGILAWRMPTADEIGSAVLHARDREQSRNDSANYEANQHQAQARQAAERAARLAAAQAEFDALPKWDNFGRPANRTPPDGLMPTTNIPAAPLGTYGNPIR